MASFGDLKFKPRYEGKAARYAFPNGYSVSVISHKYSYGGDRGLYELAVIGQDGNVCYDTPVTDDVEGFLEPEGVTKLMQQVEALPDPANATGD